MGKRLAASIKGVAGYVPPKVLTNADMERMVETTDDWIQQRVGVRERHIVDKGMAASHLATAAAQRVLEKSGTSAEEIDLIIVATVTPDMFFPATACLVQDRIGAKHAWGFDLSGACSGFLYALTIGAQFVGAGTHKKALVIGSDVMSSIIDYQDRNTCVLFGDGAGAVLLESAKSDDEGILDFQHDIDGSGGQFLFMPGGGSLHPPSQETLAQKMHCVHQDGKQVFKYAVRRMSEIACQLLEKNGYSHRDLNAGGASSGEFAHHSRHAREAWPGRFQDTDQYRSVRKHDGRHHSSGPLRCGGPRTAQEGRPGLVGCGGGRLYDGRGIDALGVLGEKDSQGRCVTYRVPAGAGRREAFSGAESPKNRFIKLGWLRRLANTLSM